MFVRFAVFACALACGSSAFAGPCAPMIDRAQTQVDARIDALAGKGRSAPESTGALRHQQPTPESIARAEQKLGEGFKAEPALVLLAQARKADEAGDMAGCEKALEQLRALAQ
ncbi:hypothetical protein [Microvirga flavescens]|uniref:hypothetical protein n=1 Tax=Microvirga flavescens TaxID=2249811 RepID=UPI001FE2004B|nr:hypothetical protein [Microvirga flavescens]